MNTGMKVLMKKVITLRGLPAVELFGDNTNAKDDFNNEN